MLLIIGLLLLVFAVLHPVMGLGLFVVAVVFLALDYWLVVFHNSFNAVHQQRKEEYDRKKKGAKSN